VPRPESGADPALLISGSKLTTQVFAAAGGTSVASLVRATHPIGTTHPTHHAIGQLTLIDGDLCVT
jgi:hypothetical protein